MCSFIRVPAAINYYLIIVRIGSPPPDITLTNGRTRLLLLSHRRGRRRDSRRNCRRFCVNLAAENGLCFICSRPPFSSRRRDPAIL